MKELTMGECTDVSAGFKLNIGHLIGSICVGFVLGGPIGIGVAIGGALVGQGVNELNEMHEQGKFTDMNKELQGALK